MANFIIDLFNKAIKGDGFRTDETPDKYNDSIAALNSTNQKSTNTTKLKNMQSKTPAASGNTTIPGK